MRPRRRGAPSGSRLRAVPARSRVTVRRGSSLPRLATLAAALRQSRDALGKLEGELDALLAALRDPSGRADGDAADRLRGAVRAAGSALAGLTR
jgi:hypothetical protein